MYVLLLFMRTPLEKLDALEAATHADLVERALEKARELTERMHATNDSRMICRLADEFERVTRIALRAIAREHRREQLARRARQARAVALAVAARAIPDPDTSTVH